MRSYFRRTFYALDNTQFRLLWFGNIFSFLGMQMQVIARGYLAYDLTHKSSALGLVMLAFGIPQLLLGLVGGVVADRFPKRNVLMVSQLVIGTNSAWVAFAIVTGTVDFWMLVVASAVQGIGFAFVGPARQAFIGDLVGDRAIGNAVVLQQLSVNSTRVIGPSVAGALIAIEFFGVGGVYILTTVGFAVATFMMLWLPAGNPAPDARTRSPIADMRDGLRYVRAEPRIAILILTSFLVVMIGFPYQSFLPAVAKDVFGAGSGGLGLLSSVGAVGAVVATVIVATYAGHPRAWAAQPMTGLAFGASLVALAVAPVFLLGLVAMVFVGALASAFQSLNNSLTMSLTEHDYHGRVQSISMLSWSLFGLIALPIGVLADAIGLRQTLVIQGALVVLSVALLQLYARVLGVSGRRRLAPVAHHEPAAAEASGGQ